MSPAISQTTLGAMGRLTGLNQATVDGAVEAVTAAGPLLVNVGAPGSLYASSLIDYRYRAGERVRMTRADDGSWQVRGPATRGTQARTSVSLPTDDAPPQSVSPSLHAALSRYAAKDSQMLRAGTVSAIRSDGSLEIRIRGGAQMARAQSDHRFRVGQRIYAETLDNGGWIVAGPSGP